MNMKKLFLFLSMILLCQMVKAQNIVSGNIASIKDVSKVKVVVDWSQVKINNLSVADWLEYRQTESPEYNAKDELENELKTQVMENVIPYCNKRIEKLNFFLLNGDNDTDVTLKIIPLTCDKKGNNISDFEFVKTNGGTSLVKIRVKSSGGVFGTMANLWGDGFKKAGENFGKYLYKGIKAARK